MSEESLQGLSLLGIGTDILKISHLEQETLTPNSAFVRKVYTPAEIQEALKREVPLHYFATRFSGKEAVFKALNITGEAFRLDEVEILNDSKGQPQVSLHGALAKRAAQQGIKRVLISLSYDTDYAVSFAVAGK